MPAFLLAIPGALKLVPRWAWYAIAGALLLAGAVIWHHGKVKSHDRAIVAARDAYWNERIAAVAKQAAALRVKAEATSATIASEERAKHEDDLRHNAADAAAYIVRGPGAAASHCGPVSHPVLPTSASGHEQAPPTKAPAGPEVPSGDWATVPWKWLVNVIQEHDDLRSEDFTWRESDSRQRDAWAKMRVSSTK